MERRDATGSQEHPAKGGHEQQGHDRRLRERHEVAERRRGLDPDRTPGEDGEGNGGAPERRRDRRMRAERPRREAGERVERPHDDLRDEERAGQRGGEAEAGDLAAASPRAGDRECDDHADRGRDVAVGHVDRGRAVEPSPRTYAPESMRRYVPAAAPSASQVNALGFARPAPAAGQRRTTAYTVSTARS